MTFLQPLFLAGLLGALVPIVIHLIHRRRPRKQPFPAIELVISSVKRVERRWRLRRILLLASRVLLIAAFAIAASRPLWSPDTTGERVPTGPVRWAIVIDTTLSMRAQYDGTTSFARALTEARNRIDALGPEDMAVVVAAASPPRLLVRRPTADQAILLDALDDLEAGFMPGDLSEAVSTAVQALGRQGASEETAPGKDENAGFSARVVILSDLAQSSFNSAAELTVPGTSETAVLEVVDVLDEVPAEKRVNRAITELDAVQVPGQAPRTVEVRARVQSFDRTGSERAATPIDITLTEDGRDLIAGSVDIVAGTIVDKPIRHSFPSAGAHPVEVSIETDGLAEDDRRFAKVDVRQQVRTLVVDGAPSGVPKDDEIYYLERALLAGTSDHPPPQIIGADELGRADFAAYDVVILAGVDVFNRQDGARLLKFVEAGGGLLVTASATLDIELYNAELGRGLPRLLRGLKRVEGFDTVGGREPIALAEPSIDDPITQPFSGEAMGGLLSTRSTGYWLLQPATEPKMDVHLRFEDGQPALVSRTFGSGRVAFLTTSIDRDLTDLPIQPAFVPVVRRLVLFLGGALEMPDERRTLVGQPRVILVPDGVHRLVVEAPDGRRSDWGRSEMDEGRVTYDRTQRPGHYRVLASFAGALEPLPSEHFSVNVDSRESDLKPLSVAEAQAVLRGEATDPSRSTKPVVTALRQSVDPESIAWFLLLAMALAFVAESLLSMRR